MGKTRHMYQYIGARLLHGLYATGGGCGLLQPGGDFVQDIAVLHMVVERGHCAELDNDVYLGGYTGGVAITKRCDCCHPVREYG